MRRPHPKHPTQQTHIQGRAMRIAEIENAQSVLGLWKVISDRTWAAIQQEAEAQERAKEERAARAKSRKPSRTKKPAPRTPPRPKPVAMPAPAPSAKASAANQAVPTPTATPAPSAAGYPAPERQTPVGVAAQGVLPAQIPVQKPQQVPAPDADKPRLKASARGMAED